jgi:anaerobic magnesium-protoporphyrin IX monomethyl ester cyclase
VFCDRSQGRRFRIRSAENVAEEMEQCYRMGITEVFIKDDTFTVDRERTLRICDEIIRRGLRLVLCIRTRVDLVSEDIIAKLKEAGCTRIQFGIESGNQRVLDLLKKNITLDQVRQAVRLAKRYKMDTLGEFMIGSPGEGQREVFDTLGFAVELDLDYVLFNIATPYPGTELYRMGIHSGLFDDFWEDIARDPMKNPKLRFWTETFTEGELRALIRNIYKRYYVRPRYILKRISKVKSFSELMEKTRFAFKIFGM